MAEVGVVGGQDGTRGLGVVNPTQVLERRLNRLSGTAGGGCESVLDRNNRFQIDDNGGPPQEGEPHDAGGGLDVGEGVGGRPSVRVNAGNNIEVGFPGVGDLKFFGTVGEPERGDDQLDVGDLVVIVVEHLRLGQGQIRHVEIDGVLEGAGGGGRHGSHPGDDLARGVVLVPGEVGIQFSADVPSSPFLIGTESGDEGGSDTPSTTSTAPATHRTARTTISTHRTTSRKRRTTESPAHIAEHTGPNGGFG